MGEAGCTGILGCCLRRVSARATDDGKFKPLRDAWGWREFKRVQVWDRLTARLGRRGRAFPAELTTYVLYQPRGCHPTSTDCAPCWGVCDHQGRCFAWAPGGPDGRGLGLPVLMNAP